MENAEISTPVTSENTDTSANVEPVQEVAENTTSDADTSAAETATDDNTAETETDEPEKLYAGKYKSVEELEKGYSEVQKFVSKASEYEKKYNELLAQKEEQFAKAKQERLDQARTRGFDSVESEEIANKVQLAEFEYFANGLNTIHPDDMENARTNLLAYYQTGNKEYLNEAKRYYSSDFIENAAVQKKDYEKNLKDELVAKQNKEAETNLQKLGETLKADYSEFLSDLSENQGKNQALKLFCNSGLIKSKEDMELFKSVYDAIAKKERESAIKEYEAQKQIDETKQKSVISSDNASTNVETGLPTRDELVSSPDLYRKAVKKWGMDKVDEIIMKG